MAESFADRVCVQFFRIYVKCTYDLCFTLLHFIVCAFIELAFLCLFGTHVFNAYNLDTHKGSSSWFILHTSGGFHGNALLKNSRDRVYYVFLFHLFPLTHYLHTQSCYTERATDATDADAEVSSKSMFTHTAWPILRRTSVPWYSTATTATACCDATTQKYHPYGNW